MHIAPDPTLAAVDAAIVARSRAEARRSYLGMSAIGHPCSRKLWYDVHTNAREDFDAATLKRFEDGHRGEALMAERLRMVPGIQLWTLDECTGKQIRFADHGGRFAGHLDGVILGLLQTPKTAHVWEHKCSAKLDALFKAKIDYGEHHALRAWNAVYFAQACLYMHYSKLQRHYLTCSSPGERSTISVRTHADPEHAAELIDKARRILDARVPLARVSNDPAWHVCRVCRHHARCHA